MGSRWHAKLCGALLFNPKLDLPQFYYFLTPTDRFNLIRRRRRPRFTPIGTQASATRAEKAVR